VVRASLILSYLVTIEVEKVDTQARRHPFDGCHLFTDIGSPWQMECFGHLFHLRIAHTFRLEAHGAAVDVDLCTLGEHVDLVEGIHDVLALGEDTVLLPHHDIVILQFLKRALSELDTSGELIRHDAETQWTEGFCLGDHAPQELRQHVFAQELTVVAHGNELDGVRVERGFVTTVRGHLMRRGRGGAKAAHS
jgi:hypothetical protein